jgi:hypothetical protein
MKYIRLAKNKKAIVDDEDYESLNKFEWRVCNTGYAVRSVGNSKKRTQITILMHRFIMKAQPKQQIDHVNRDRLDNRKCNLRFCNDSQNQANRGASKGNNSGYKGVYHSRHHWKAEITCKKIRYFLGVFDNKVDAAKAYNEKAKELFGEFAKPNIINSPS